MPKLENAVHHWWPRALSKFWANNDGVTHRISSDGELLASQPKSFGGIRNDNNVRIGGGWDFSFESTFNKADDAFATVIPWLYTLSCSTPAKDARFEERLSKVEVTDDQQAILAECLASLIARSPNLRQRVRLTAAYYQRDFGLRDPTDERLVGLNSQHAQESIASAMARRGKFVVLWAGDREFIFGDGFLHNISMPNNPPLSPRCLIPLTPGLAVFYSKPLQYRSYPQAFSLNLTRDEVDFVNNTVQIYSKRYLFFRDIYPVLTSEFTCNEHREFEYHKHPWIDALEQTMATRYFGSRRQ